MRVIPLKISSFEEDDFDGTIFSPASSCLPETKLLAARDNSLKLSDASTSDITRESTTSRDFACFEDVNNLYMISEEDAVQLNRTEEGDEGDGILLVTQDDDVERIDGFRGSIHHRMHHSVFSVKSGFRRLLKGNNNRHIPLDAIPGRVETAETRKRRSRKQRISLALRRWTNSGTSHVPLHSEGDSPVNKTTTNERKTRRRRWAGPFARRHASGPRNGDLSAADESRIKSGNPRSSRGNSEADNSDRSKERKLNLLSKLRRWASSIKDRMIQRQDTGAFPQEPDQNVAGNSDVTPVNFVPLKGRSFSFEVKAR